MFAACHPTSDVFFPFPVETLSGRDAPRRVRSGRVVSTNGKSQFAKLDAASPPRSCRKGEGTLATSIAAVVFEEDYY